MRCIRPLFAAVFLVIAASDVRAEDAAKPLDDAFLIQAAPWENAVIVIGKLAEKRADSPKVKEFAAQTVKDHQKCYEKLAASIKSRKLGVASGFEKDNQAVIDRLGKLSGAEFDREFLTYMIKSHKDEITICESQSKDGKVVEMRDFATEALPKLREHLTRAEELAKSVNP